MDVEFGCQVLQNSKKFEDFLNSDLSPSFVFVVLQLCCNQLTGKLPSEIRFLKRLSVLALQYNRLDGQIPSSLGDLGMLKRLDLSFNRLFGPIPKRLSSIQTLEILDVTNNTLSGIVSPGKPIYLVHCSSLCFP